VDAETRRLAGLHQVQRVEEWGNWSQEIWERFEPTVSFAVLRDTATLVDLYPTSMPEAAAFAIERGAARVGWFSLYWKQMTRSPHFGNLRVATLADGVGDAAALRAALPVAVEEAKRKGAHLLITNQSAPAIRNACLAGGMREGPSNYLLAISKALAEQIDEATVYVTRRDGDGLVHLMTGWNGAAA
jgi:hypothetical protein